MNSKKRGKRASRFNPTFDRGARVGAKEGKSNIAVKRVTLLPGFLINGYSSDTAKKTKVQKERRTKEHILTDNVEAFLERKGNLRRSERILKKYYKRNASSDKSSKSDLGLPSISNPCPRSVSIKSILKKKNSKSIFKEISDKFSKVYVENHNNRVKMLPTPNQSTTSSTSAELIDLTEDPHVYNIETAPNRQLIEPVYNRNICEDFFSKIRVTFKKNAIEECRENIRREINLTNLVLEGKLHRKDLTLYDSKDNDSDIRNNDNMLPVPERNWIYCTPKNQKITIPQAEECQVKPGMICVNKNHRNIYEFDSGNFQTSNPVFSNRIEAIMKTPANFVPKRGPLNMYPLTEHGFGVIWAPANDIGVNGKMPTRTSYLDSEIQTPETLGNHAVDFTFMEEQSNFKMQPSQPLLHRKKRPLIDGEKLVAKKHGYPTDEREDKPKMFDFNSQDRNMFDFGVIM